VGFILTVEGQRIYHAGDTDAIPEMESIDADIALLPLSGTYVMTADQAVEAAKAIKPETASGENLVASRDSSYGKVGVCALKRS
jgi:L-ascorbate metabolism protein UlaG (beta-lactamase superfamily)